MPRVARGMSRVAKLVSRCATSATRCSGAPANPPSTGSAGSRVSFMNRSLCSLESQTTEIR